MSAANDDDDDDDDVDNNDDDDDDNNNVRYGSVGERFFQYLTVPVNFNVYNIFVLLKIIVLGAKRKK